MDLKHEDRRAGFSEAEDLQRSCLRIGTDLRAIAGEGFLESGCLGFRRGTVVYQLRSII